MKTENDSAFKLGNVADVSTSRINFLNHFLQYECFSAKLHSLKNIFLSIFSTIFCASFRLCSISKIVSKPQTHFI